MRNKWRSFVLMVLALTMLAGCASTGDVIDIPEGDEEMGSVEDVVIAEEFVMEEIDLYDEAVALSSSPAADISMYMSQATGEKVKENSKAIIDYSNTNDGYVMTKFTAKTDKKLKVKVKGPTTEYVYNVKPDEWCTFSLADGNGEYKVTVYENTTGTKYASVVSETFSVTLDDEFGPFLCPNQYVNYAVDAEDAVALAAELVKGVTDPLEKVKKVYEYVVANLSYDKEKAKTVQSGYLPVLDDVLAAKKGICFDYAALMAGMLRSQGVPCKLVVGYAGDAYHAWISVYTEEAGWIDAAIYFNGSSWQRMDPTFASSSGNNAEILKYIGDGSNYHSKNFY